MQLHWNKLKYKPLLIDMRDFKVVFKLYIRASVQNPFMAI